MQFRQESPHRLDTSWRPSNLVWSTVEQSTIPAEGRVSVHIMNSRTTSLYPGQNTKHTNLQKWTENLFAFWCFRTSEWPQSYIFVLFWKNLCNLCCTFLFQYHKCCTFHNPLINLSFPMCFDWARYDLQTFGFLIDGQHIVFSKLILC